MRLSQPPIEPGPPPRWWGRYELPDGAAARWTVGPLRLWATHHVGHWSLAWHRGSDPLAPDLAMPCLAGGEDGADASDPPADASVLRVATRRAEKALVLQPALADRSVVVRPFVRLKLLADDEAQFYLSTPLWLRLLGEPSSRELLDTPTFRPSDTWFGPSTREGELCYASRTNARASAAELQVLPARARTWVRVVNTGRHALDIARFSLPASHLTLYAGSDGTLWTNGVTVRPAGDEGLAEARFEPGPPTDCPDPQRLAAPRQVAERNVLRRALGALLG
jgi:hypothetical protein